jgi:hypothetical protein
VVSVKFSEQNNQNSEVKKQQTRTFDKCVVLLIKKKQSGPCKRVVRGDLDRCDGTMEVY